MQLVWRKHQFSKEHGKIHTLLLHILNHKVYTSINMYSSVQKLNIHDTFFGILK